MADAARLHIDLCTGLGGWTAPFKDAPGWRSFGLDVRDDLNADVLGDVRALPFDCRPTLVTASPPCRDFVRWMLPWLEEPDPDLSLVEACLEAVETLQPRYWVLENSRGLHQYWKPARTRYGAFYLWGDFPPFDAPETWKGKMQTSGERPEERAKIPYPLADALRRSVETYTDAQEPRLVADGGRILVADVGGGPE